MKLFASFLAVGIFAAPSAFAQAYMSPGPACMPGDLNCPTYEAPLRTGRSATEVAPMYDPEFGAPGDYGSDTLRSESFVKRDGALGFFWGNPPLGSGNSNR